MDTKYCPFCKQIKLTTDFGGNRTKKDRLSSYCKKCKLTKKREDYLAHIEARRIYNRDYQRVHPSIQTKFQKLKKRATKGGIEIVITASELDNWLQKQSSYCHYCDKELGTGRKLNGCTIDRKDNGRGYSLDNMVLACNQCNITKGSWFSCKQMLEIAQKYLKK